ncbi:MAG: DEAD/DEAH box helicase [Pirellulales bacterium]
MKTFSVDLRLTPPDVRSLAVVEDRPLQVQELAGWIPAGRCPGTISIPLTRLPVRVTSVDFPDILSTPQAARSHSLAPSSEATISSRPLRIHRPQACQTRTRVRPPEDVIRLEDRLFFLLQPPLESLLADNQITFPFRPFSYQLEGVAFLVPRHQALLADEMGLGKTMQAITALRLLVRGGQIRRVLLICPKALVTNWRRELAQWAPELPVAVVEGDPHRRRWLWDHDSAVITIANYELAVRDERHLTQREHPFDLVVLDESQRIKNRLSATSQVVCRIPRRRSWALTGTPVENSCQDLVGIFEFLAPGQLHPDMKPRRVGRAASDYVLRRTKDKVLAELPPKLLRDAEVSLTPEQQETYRRAEEDGVVRLNEMGDNLTIRHVFELILRLKQICNFDPATGASTKLERLRVDLQECAASGQKAIIFSQWVDSLIRLRDALSDYGPLEYHGRIAAGRRDAVLDRFRNDPSHQVLLMSYGAGGVGLNLQFVGYVFLFDRWWNPAVEDQAINRAHRIGVASPVTVTRFLATGTIEQRIDQILEEKRDLIDTVFSGAQAVPMQALSHEDVFGLFRLKFPTTRAA